MNIKSLLLGSAAALAAVTGARAADAVVVAEPEPAEYVKVCDVYGAGYFYIPGTDTCLRIGGYVRYDIGMGDVGTFDGARTSDVLSGKDQATWRKNTRLGLKTWTGQETELGTLKTYTEIEFNFGNHNADSPQNSASNGFIFPDAAWIQLGGLRVGKDKSVFDSFIDWAGNVIQDTIVPYGAFDTNAIEYYFDAGNGLTAAVSLEEGSGDAGTLNAGGGFFSNSGNDTIDSYVPNVVGGVKYKQDWGAIAAVGAYDSAYEEWAGKIRADVNVSSSLSLFIMGGYGTDNNIDRNFYKQWGGNWAFWGGGTYKFNQKTSLNVQVSGDQQKNYGAAASIAYDMVPGFTITAEVDYNHDGQFGKPTDRNWANANKENSIGGLLRFKRSF